MIGPDTIVAGAKLTAGIRLPRAEESWEPVIFGGLIPFAGVVGACWLIWKAFKDNPENDLPEEDRPSSPNYRYANLPREEAIARAKKEGGPEDPPS
ncbi:MAG TPA: hypothetical protein VN671_07080 [Solirubrobacterales bacterium]|nr:hypothetical protein [Solirubrobacterales bacterium]